MKIMKTNKKHTKNSAIISNCGTYRYRLDRHLSDVGPTYAFFGINPSTADASIDDATVRKWRGFCERLHVGHFIVGNVFAYRATDIKKLAEVDKPFGSEWCKNINSIIKQADVLVPCWGSLNKLPKRLRPVPDLFLKVLQKTGKPLMCWGLTKCGQPKHPLMLSYKTQLIDMAN